MEAPVASKHYSGAVLFYVIPNLKNYEADAIYDSLAQINTIVGESALVKKVGKRWSGSTASGLFVIASDQSNVVPHEHIAPLFETFSRGGVPVRCGVSRGDILSFEDTDGEVNFVGGAINSAARLAYSDQNPGCLLHEKYTTYAEDFPSSKEWKSWKAHPMIVVKGKKHDLKGFKCLAVGKPEVYVLDAFQREVVPQKHREAPHAPGVVLAYDLAHFSAGDESAQSKRVAGIVGTFKLLKHDSKSVSKAKLYLCPGGDGGILVLSNLRQEALWLAKDLEQRLRVQSEGMAASISVEARVGVHYGEVTLYPDVAGRLRPTGRTCFVADEIISDEAASNASLVFSEALKEVISGGSASYLEQHFTMLPALNSGPAKDLDRYAPKKTDDLIAKHPFWELLFGKTSSWQPESLS